MRHFLILILMTAALPAIAQRSNDTARIYLNENLAITRKKDVVYPALLFRQQERWLLYAVYPNKDQLLVMPFLDNDLKIRQGSFIAYHPGKKPWIRGNYDKNIPQGEWAFYDRDGNLQQSGEIRDGSFTGDWKFYQDGKLSAIRHFKGSPATPVSAAGSREKNNHPDNGSLLALHQISSVLDGPSRSFYPNGSLRDSGRYANNTQQGSWIYLHPDGTLMGKGNYDADSLSGTWYWYRTNGQPATIEEYAHNKLVSLQCFDADGRPAGNACPVLKQPYPLGIPSNFILHAENSLFIPDTLKNILNYGEVKLRVNISEQGKLSAVRILSATHPLLAAEAETFVRSLKEWSPAIIHNMAMDFEMEYTLPFYRFREKVEPADRR